MLIICNVTYILKEKLFSDGIDVYCDYKLTGERSKTITMEISNLDLDTSNAIYTLSPRKMKMILTGRGLFHDLVFRNNSICTIDVS
jgi:hypothetical protein